MNRSIRRLYVVLAGGFGLLMLMLGWWQVVAADDLKDRPGNTQTLLAERLVDRGRILSADAKVLAASRAVGSTASASYQRALPAGQPGRARRRLHVLGRQRQTGIESTYNRYLSGSFGTEPLLQRLDAEGEAGRRRRAEPRHARPGGRRGGPGRTSAAR